MTGIPARLTVVTLGARDLPSLRAFYARLGWPERAGSSDEFSSFVLGGVLLALYPLGELAAEAVPGPPGEPGVWNGITLACNVDSRDDVDPAFRAAVDAGATPVAEPVDRAWGGRSGYVADPEGNRWEIAWQGAATFDERGALLTF
ncbi:glyoxalase [Paractinoplanes abujensis]|uniref:Catechol 2,3-dioxygenase-like lactoylglutathione lyase family enzyme n=1 Tax=Paractinoplanes abujensis TaxID=882441 RepID=A0A7W7FZ86_9ACTN|nr:VOC family protein [Actinoplanes abujensis]MBB4691808.1 catechol 2,3-dioxygenase-like lactoylglutathione lyase family enzyme [Actinoplanes abujensis]GID16771.1 glyoxalase [Actinoplanes abujensis]